MKRHTGDPSTDFDYEPGDLRSLFAVAFEWLNSRQRELEVDLIREAHFRSADSPLADRKRSQLAEIRRQRDLAGALARRIQASPEEPEEASVARLVEALLPEAGASRGRTGPD